MLNVAVSCHGAVDSFWQAYNAVSIVAGLSGQAECGGPIWGRGGCGREEG